MSASGAGPHKALLQLAGVPLVQRSLERLLASGVVTGAIIATHPDDLPAMNAVLSTVAADAKKAPWKNALCCVAGGATRQASCFSALRTAAERTPAAEQSSTAVLFHDAARPLITAAEVIRTLEALQSAPAAVLATRVTQTVKRAGAEGLVQQTVPREALYLAQTPQAFRLPAALDAFRYAEEAGFEATDDVALAEYRGLAVKIVEGSPWNLKITTPDDLVLAQAILKLQSASA